MPIDTRAGTSASRGGRPGIEPGRGGSGKCANPSGCRYGRCSGTVGAGAVGVAETAETPAGGNGKRVFAGFISMKWRMGWDSNPRCACTHAGFQDRCLKPLGHPSVAAISVACRSLPGNDPRSARAAFVLQRVDDLPRSSGQRRRPRRAWIAAAASFTAASVFGLNRPSTPPVSKPTALIRLCRRRTGSPLEPRGAPARSGRLRRC